MRYRFTQYLICCLYVPVSNSLEVIFVALLPHYAPLITSIPALGAILNLTVSQAQRTYQSRFNVSIEDLYSPVYRSCADVEINQAWMAAEYYYGATTAEKCLAFIVAGCNDPWTMAKLSREWDIPYFPSGYGLPLGSRQEYPTVISLASTSIRYVQVMFTIFQHFRWRHAVFIIDIVNPIPFHAEIAQLLRNGKVANTMREGDYRLEYLTISGNNSQSIVKALQRGRQRNRVFVLGCHTLLTRDILRSASQENMTNGDYAFINFQPIDLLPYGKYSQIKNATSQELSGYRSLLLFTVPLGSTSSDANLNIRIVAMSKELYNFTFEPGSQPLDYFVTQQIQRVVEIYSQLVNESLQQIEKDPRTCGGTAVASAASNRTFALSGGEIFLDSDANMDLPYTVFAYNTLTREMQNAAAYSPADCVMVWSEDFAPDWPGPYSEPPRDVPVCGFSGEEGPCLWERRQMRSVLVGKICGAAVGLVVLLALIARFLHRMRQDETGWFISADLLETVESGVSSSQQIL